MENFNKAFNGFGTDIFAAISVKNYQNSLDWYNRFFGCEPSFLPNDVEAVWQITEHQWIYIIVKAEHSGHSVQNIMVDDLNTLTGEIAERGINFSTEELPAINTRKVVYYDPDGNEIGLISVSP